MATSDIYIIATITFLAVLVGIFTYYDIKSDNSNDGENKKHHQ